MGLFRWGSICLSLPLNEELEFRLPCWNPRELPELSSLGRWVHFFSVLTFGFQGFIWTKTLFLEMCSTDFQESSLSCFLFISSLVLNAHLRAVQVYIQECCLMTPDRYIAFRNQFEIPIVASQAGSSWVVCWINYGNFEKRRDGGLTRRSAETNTHLLQVPTLRKANIFIR